MTHEPNAKGPLPSPPGPAQRGEAPSARLWGTRRMSRERLPGGGGGAGLCHPLPEERKFVISPELLGCHGSGFLTHLALPGRRTPSLRRRRSSRWNGEAGSFRRGSPHHPLPALRALSPYLRGVSHLQTLPAEPSRRQGSASQRLLRPAWRARSGGAFPAASCCSGIKESRIQISFLAAAKAPAAGPGGSLSGGLVQGASSASSGKVKCASWIAAAVTA